MEMGKGRWMDFHFEKAEKAAYLPHVPPSFLDAFFAEMSSPSCIDLNFPPLNSVSQLLTMMYSKIPNPK